MKVNDILKVKIINLDHKGRGIAKVDNKVIFISNALINEEVEIKITKVKKKYFEAEVVKILKESEERIKPICKYFNLCGGCDLLHMGYHSQLLYKKNKVIEILNKFTNIDSNKVSDVEHICDYYNYRNKVIFHGGDNIGFYIKESHNIISIDNCKISNKLINKIIPTINKLNSKDINEIMIRASEFTNDLMVVIDFKVNVNNKKIIDLFKNKVTSLIIKTNNKYYSLLGSDNITEKMNDFSFVISPESFFQVNTKMAIKLYDKVASYIEFNKNDNVLDLYCGTGTISIYISKYVNKVLGIDINKCAIKNALINKQINSIKNVDFIRGDVAKVLDKIDFKPDVIIVDPPRSGLDKTGISTILDLQPSKIIYISCDPVTLARDLNLLSKRYDINEIIPFDMFPNTNHVECVVSMTKINFQIKY